MRTRNTTEQRHAFEKTQRIVGHGRKTKHKFHRAMKQTFSRHGKGVRRFMAQGSGHEDFFVMDWEVPKPRYILRHNRACSEGHLEIYRGP